CQQQPESGERLVEVEVHGEGNRVRRQADGADQQRVVEAGQEVQPEADGERDERDVARDAPPPRAPWRDGVRGREQRQDRGGGAPVEEATRQRQRVTGAEQPQPQPAPPPARGEERQRAREDEAPGDDRKSHVLRVVVRRAGGTIGDDRGDVEIAPYGLSYWL